MMKRIGMAVIAATLVAGLGTATARAQLISNAPNRSLPATQAVQYVFPQQVHLTAGKPTAVTLHFRVANGMHINSHTPLNGYLIPTTFTIPAGSAVRLESVNFPPGADITLPAAPKTKLNVYTGDFVVHTRIVASRSGNHLVQGKLRYQACTVSQCMPPKTITAAFDVIAK